MATWYFILVCLPLRTEISPPWEDSILSIEMHIPGWSCSSAIPAPDPFVLVDVQLYFPKQHAEHLGMPSSLIVNKIEGMIPRRANWILDRKFMWPSCLWHFRRDSCASVNLSVFPPSWWSSKLHALNLEMLLTYLYMGRPLWALYFVVYLNPPKLNDLHPFLYAKPSPLYPVCFQFFVNNEPNW